MYQNYVNNYSSAATRLAKLRKKSSFSSYCDKHMTPNFNNLALESLIILPIQVCLLQLSIIRQVEPTTP